MPNVYKKMRGRGRPPGRTFRGTIPVRLTDEVMAAIDVWIGQQGEGISRSEALRRLIEDGLAAQPGRRMSAAGQATQRERQASMREARILLERADRVLARAEKPRRRR